MPASADNILDSNWMLFAIRQHTGETILTNAICKNPPTEPILTFQPNGNFIADLCCNTFRGRFVIDKDSSKLNFFDSSYTFLGCIGFEGLEDQAFAQQLQDVSHYSFEDNKLVLKSKSQDFIYVASNTDQ